MRKLPALQLNPVDAVVDGSRRFRSNQGLNPRDTWDFSRIVVTDAGVQAIADAYMALPFVGNGARGAWNALAEETQRQYAFMTSPAGKGGMGITVSAEDTDPYDMNNGGTRAIFDDMRNGCIQVQQQPETLLMSADVRTMFRAVHDVFGHGGTGRGVDRHGEEAAYRKHTAMYSPLARQALATEQRGQNCAMIANNGTYQETKFAILPRSARDFHAVIIPATTTEYRRAFKHAAMAHTAQNI